MQNACDNVDGVVEILTINATEPPILIAKLDPRNKFIVSRFSRNDGKAGCDGSDNNKDRNMGSDDDEA